MCKQLKWLAEGRCQFPVLPGAVRNNEIEEAPFFSRILLFEQALGVSCQFENADPFFEVGLVSRLVLLDQLSAAALLGSPFRRHAIEECGIDTPVELVDVHRVKPVLKAVVLDLQSGDGLFVVTFLVGVALSQRRPHPVEHFIVKGQPPEQISELLFEHLFTDVGLVAFPFVAGAVIVDVPLLLDLGDDRAAAMTAFDQTGERELVLGAAMALGVAAVENVLQPLPQLAGHERLVAPLIDAAVPLELAHVDARAQHPVDGTDRQGIATLAEGQAFRPRHSGNLPERQGAGRIPFEQPSDQRSQLRIRLDQPLAVRPGNIAITERGERGPDALLGLLQHALVHLLR